MTVENEGYENITMKAYLVKSSLAGSQKKGLIDLNRVSMKPLLIFFEKGAVNYVRIALVYKSLFCCQKFNLRSRHAIQLPYRYAQLGCRRRSYFISFRAFQDFG